MKRCKLLVVACKGGISYSEMSKHISGFCKKYKITDPTILNTFENAGDRHVVCYAAEHDLKLKLFKVDSLHKPQTEQYKVKALIRNESIASFATHALIFWNEHNQNVKDIIEW